MPFVAWQHIMVRDIEGNIAHLDDRIELLAAGALAPIDRHRPLRRDFAQLTSIPGIAAHTAVLPCVAHAGHHLQRAVPAAARRSGGRRHGGRAHPARPECSGVQHVHGPLHRPDRLRADGRRQLLVGQYVSRLPVSAWIVVFNAGFLFDDFKSSGNGYVRGVRSGL